MSELLESTDVFVDTNIFETANFNFSSRKMRELQERALDGTVTLHVTELIKRETISRIHERINDARREVDQIARKTKILNNDRGFYDAVRRIRDGAVEEDIIREFEQFLLNSRAEIEDSSTASMTEVLNSYYERQPPFQHDRHQFVDAITRENIKTWVRRNHTPAVFLTSDGDFNGAFDDLTDDEHVYVYRTVEDLLDRITSTMAAKDDFLRLLNSQWDVVDRALNDHFEEVEVVLTGYEEIEVDSIRLESIGGPTFKVIGLESDYALVEINATLSVLCDFTHLDPDSFFWDSEDRVAYHFHRRSRSDEYDVEANFEVEITYDADSQTVSVESTFLEDHDLLEIDVR